jgi:hypothetical protein
MCFITVRLYGHVALTVGQDQRVCSQNTGPVVVRPIMEPLLNGASVCGPVVVRPSSIVIAVLCVSLLFDFIGMLH